MGFQCSKIKEPQEITILLIGQCCSGKTTFLRTLIQGEPSSAPTIKFDTPELQVDGITIRLIDTPGISNIFNPAIDMYLNRADFAIDFGGAPTLRRNLKVYQIRKPIKDARQALRDIVDTHLCL